MRKITLLIALIICITDVLSLNKELPMMKGDTLITKCGYKFINGQDIKIGVGTMPDGDFKYIRQYTSPIFAYTTASPNQAIQNQDNALTRNHSGFKYAIKKIEKRGDDRRGYVYYLKIGLGLMSYEIDIENAITTGEVSIPEEFKADKEKIVVVKQQLSAADEIAKLKKLLDEGALTKEEFEYLKKKILDTY